MYPVAIAFRPVNSCYLGLLHILGPFCCYARQVLRFKPMGKFTFVKTACTNTIGRTDLLAKIYQLGLIQGRDSSEQKLSWTVTTLTAALRKDKSAVHVFSAESSPG
jgi:hypothetical protein